MEEFREVLDECGFRDLGFVGGKFTWCNGHPDGYTIWERLDRAVASIEWLDKFPATKVIHLECGSSDHKPILICLNGIPRSRNKPWRFEHMWLEEEGCRDTVEAAWQFNAPGQAMSRVEGKINHCQTKLKWWSRMEIGNVTKLLKDKKVALRKAEEEAIAGGSIYRVNRLKREINDLLSKEEKMWKQRSRALWLHEGDRNTRYFHSRATHRYGRNRIEALENALGEKCVEENGIANILVDFYQNLFTSASPSRIEEALEATPRVVTDEMNQTLVAPFVKAEVEIALSQMEALKSPGPDGMPPLFFQQFWPIIWDEVADAVLTCLNTGSIPPSINQTFITLIPKVKSPVRVSEYRPIALCNILYKLISKVIANRLKNILPSIISETQSAFQSSKAISDNILIAFETLHHMKNQKSKKLGFMALKLDMSKAYDPVEWSYLVKIMEKLGFCEKWVSLVHECISTVSYSILVNGEPRGDIRPSKGIRQGDPLSPCLFL